MKVSGKTLAIAAVMVLIGFYITKSLTEVTQEDLSVVKPQQWLVLGKAHKGGMKTDEFESFFRECELLRKNMGDSLSELTRYYVEPTQENERYTEVFSGVIVPDSSVSLQGYELKLVSIGRAAQVTDLRGKRLYDSLDQFSLGNELTLDASQVVEIIRGRYMTVIMELR